MTIRSMPRAPLLAGALLAATLAARADEAPWPGPSWPRATPAEMGMDAARLREARDYALTGGGSGCIIRRGRLVMQWGDPRRTYDLKSSTKSIGGIALGLALKDGKIRSLAEKAGRYHPSLGRPPESNAKTGWLGRITIFHLATQTAGFGKSGGYTKLEFAPGTKWRYSDGGPNWLAECITLQYNLLFDRVFKPLGIKPSDLTWRNNAYRPRKIAGVARREFGSGISANVDAMARVGYLYLRRGRWRGESILPASFVAACATTPKALRALPVVDPKRYGKASAHYGLLWWNNADATLKHLPPDAYWSWGLYDSLIVVVPSLDIVVARAGKSFKKGWGGHYGVLKGFLEPIAASVRPSRADRPALPK